MRSTNKSRTCCLNISKKNFGKLFNFIREHDEKFSDFLKSLGEDAYSMTGEQIVGAWLDTLK